MVADLTWSHYIILLSIENEDELSYYITQTINRNLSKRKLQEIIKLKEYQRLPIKTKEKLIKQEKTIISDFIKNPIIIKNKYDYKDISKKILKQLIIEDLDNFLLELGEGFTYVKSEYKIKIGNNYNYIDLLLYNLKFNCYVVVELKVTELKKEHIGQIEVYMNYIDKNIKDINQNKTIGVIISKKDNMFIIEYASDKRIFNSMYVLN